MLSNRDAAVLDALFNSRGEYSGIYINNGEQQQDPEENQREQEAVQWAEEFKFEKSIEILTEIIEKNPSFASAYNNRAQVYRMMGDNFKALNDLETCISLEPNASILRKAYLQRSLIYKSDSDFEKSQESLIKAAQYGSLQAKVLLKDKNPYSKMCSQILSQIIQ